MKILLINPPASESRKFTREGRCTQESGFWATLWPPLTLAYMGAILERGGHEVRIVDGAAEALSFEKTIAIVGVFKPKLIVCSSSTPSIDSDLNFIARTKELFPDIYTATFGVHATIFPEKCLKDCGQLDFIICGEPENVIDRLAKSIVEASLFADIPGIVYRDSAGRAVFGKPAEFIKDIDSLPFPAWHLIKRHKYRLPLKGKDFLLVLPSRGCPYSCTFCTTQNYYGNKVRLRSVKNVVDELEHDIDRFGTRNFLFWSETFTFDKSYVNNLCTEINRRGLAISWTCNSRVDVVDEDVLKKMAGSGCWMISFGIESASQQILDKARKGTKVEQAVSAVNLARRAGLSVVGHFIFGLPGENGKTIDETIRFSRSLDLDFAQYYCAVPFPGSELYSTALKEGWIREYDFSRFSQGEPILELPTVTRNEVARGKERAHREYYRNPKRLLRTMRYVNFMSIGNLMRSFSQAIRFLGAKKERSHGNE